MQNLQQGGFSYVFNSCLSIITKRQARISLFILARAVDLTLIYLSGIIQRRATRGSKSALIHSSGYGIYSAADFISVLFKL